MKIKLKIKIEGDEDRRTLAGILAANGISVKIKDEKKTPYSEKEYYIIFECPDEQ